MPLDWVAPPTNDVDAQAVIATTSTANLLAVQSHTGPKGMRRALRLRYYAATKPSEGSICARLFASDDSKSPESPGSDKEEDDSRRASGAAASTSGKQQSTLSRIFGQSRRPAVPPAPRQRPGPPGAQRSMPGPGDEKPRSGPRIPPPQPGTPRSRQQPFRQPLERSRQMQRPQSPLPPGTRSRPRPQLGQLQRDGGPPASDPEVEDMIDPSKSGRRPRPRSPREPPPGGFQENRLMRSDDGRRGPRSRPPARQSSREDRSSRARLEGATPLELEFHQDQEKYRLAPAEPMALIKPGSMQRIRSTADLPIYETEVAMEAERARAMKYDPVVNLNWGMPVRRPPPQPEEFAERYKAEWMETLDFKTDAEWQEFKAASLEGVEQDLQDIRKNFGYRDYKAEEQELDRLRDSVPKRNPFYPHVAMSVHQLQQNPWWSFEQKQKYMKGLIREVKR